MDPPNKVIWPLPPNALVLPGPSQPQPANPTRKRPLDATCQNLMRSQIEARDRAQATVSASENFSMSALFQALNESSTNRLALSKLDRFLPKWQHIRHSLYADILSTKKVLLLNPADLEMMKEKNSELLRMAPVQTQTLLRIHKLFFPWLHGDHDEQQFPAFIHNFFQIEPQLHALFSELKPDYLDFFSRGEKLLPALAFIFRIGESHKPSSMMQLSSVLETQDDSVLERYRMTLDDFEDKNIKLFLVQYVLSDERNQEILRTAISETIKLQI